MKYKTSIRTVAPGVALVTDAQARRWLHRDDDDDIEDIDLLIASAMSHLDGIDGILRRALLSQQWSDIWSGFTGRCRLPLALAPVSIVASIKYYDAANMLQVLDANLYSLHQDFAGFYLHLASDESWPSTYDRDDAVTVFYTAGYGETAADVPAEIRLAVRELLEVWCNCGGERPDSLPAGIMTKLRRFIRPHF